MNERIEELQIQAEAAADEIFDRKGKMYGEIVMEKFAELILRECVQVCADRGKHHDGLYSAWAVDCSERIEKHFGVE